MAWFLNSRLPGLLAVLYQQGSNKHGKIRRFRPQNFEKLESESKAAIIAAIKLQIDVYHPSLKELINHHYNAMRYSKNAENFLRFLKEKLT